MFSLSGPCNKFKIKWIEFSCSSKGGKTFSPDEILKYCKYQQENRPLFPIRSRSKSSSPLHRESRITKPSCGFSSRPTDGFGRRGGRGGRVLPRGRSGSLGGGGFDRRCGGGGARDFTDDFRGEGFAHLAGGIVDATLRQRKLATAIAGFGVEAVQRDFPLLGGKLGKVHAGKLTGAVGVLQKNFAGVLERFHFEAGGQAEERADFGFVERGIAQANMFLDDAALGVKKE